MASKGKTSSKTETVSNVQNVVAIVKKGEPIDRALKRLKSKLESEGVLEEVRRLRAFETPKAKLLRKARAASKRGKIRFRFNLASANKGEAAQESTPGDGIEERLLELVKKKISGAATSKELEELATIREGKRRERREKAPLHIQELKAIHQKLAEERFKAIAG